MNRFAHEIPDTPEATKIRTSCSDSSIKLVVDSGITIPDSVNTSSQYRVSSASSSAMDILAMKSAFDFARHEDR